MPPGARAAMRVPIYAFAASCAALVNVSALAGSVGDPARGAKIYERCGACHSLDADRAGPRHRGLIGRVAGAVPGFAYSPALKRSGLVWDEATLDRFLANPLGLVPGTRMYVSVSDQRDRADLIAYLKSATQPQAE